jgi:hypothetical protein
VYSKSSKIIVVTLIAPSTPFVWPAAYMCCMLFQKKAKSGIRTPKSQMDLIRERLKRAEKQHAEWTQEQKEAP